MFQATDKDASLPDFIQRKSEEAATSPAAPAATEAGLPGLLVGDSAALFADVRRKYAGVGPSNRETANWFRLSEVLDHAEAALTQAAALRAKLAHEGEQEKQLLKRDEELRGLRAGVSHVLHCAAKLVAHEQLTETKGLSAAPMNDFTALVRAIVPFCYEPGKGPSYTIDPNKLADLPPAPLHRGTEEGEGVQGA